LFCANFWFFYTKELIRQQIAWVRYCFCVKKKLKKPQNALFCVFLQKRMSFSQPAAGEELLLLGVYFV
jgi:hypothetical protein